MKEKPKPKPKAVHGVPNALVPASSRKSMLKAGAREFDAMLRGDFVMFVEKVFETVSSGDAYKPNWHVEAMAYRLALCLSGECQRLGIFMPPRHLKSIVVSVAFTAWVLGHDPARRIIVASHSLDLCAKLASQFRQVVDSAWYKRLFPHMRAGVQKDTEFEFVTSKGGGRLAVSVGSSVTGRGADLIIVDDPMKADLAENEAEQKRVRTWFDQTLSTRHNNKKTGVTIVVMQRLSTRDLAAHLIDSGDWETLTLAAIAEKDERSALSETRFHFRAQGEPLHPEHEDEVVFKRQKTQMGAAGFAAQYQQAPIPFGGGLLPLDWFRRYGKLPDRRHWDMLIHSYDTASSIEDGASYTVIQSWAVIKGRLYLENQLRRRMRYPELRKLAFDLMKVERPDFVLIEDGSTGRPLFDELYFSLPPREREFRLRRVKVDRSKEQRVIIASPFIEAGQVFLPQRAPFMAELESELRSFPGSIHDDQVDALTQAVHFYVTGGWKRMKPRVYGLDFAYRTR